MKFSPASVSCFHFLSFAYDEAKAEARFEYALDDAYSFRETLTFPGALPIESEAAQNALQGALRELHLALGVSYYKAAVPEQISVRGGGIPKATADFFSKLYTKGLGEFAFKNQLDLRERVKFPVAEAARLQSSALPLKRRSIVPLGGGKDSLVTLELLKQSGQRFSTLTMGDWESIQQLKDLTGVPHITITRSIDPLLFRLNQEGAYNGHVPFSSILAFMLPVAAILYGFDTVVLSQERSADRGNTLYLGEEVNHQYSKSFEFEQDFSHYVRSAVLSQFRYFSLLRPFSELAIARHFSQLTKYHSAFTSCNAAFKLQETGLARRWCCNCPKCRFVFLALAPFCERAHLLEIFGHNLLDDETQIQGYAELLGLQGHKPFECVGEIEESRAALHLLCENQYWSQDLVPKTFSGPMIKETPLESVFELNGAHAIPAEYTGLIHASR